MGVVILLKNRYSLLVFSSLSAPWLFEVISRYVAWFMYSGMLETIYVWCTTEGSGW